VASKKAYPCFCDAERLDQVRAKCREEKRQPKYDRHCLTLSSEEIAGKLEAGEKHVIRMLVPDGDRIEFEDGIRGEVQIPFAQLDDQVLLKSDGFPTYHLANVVDDHLMGITHVIRAEEWISSTPKHVLLYKAFGWQEPAWFHLPLLRNKDKSKISKRKNPVSLLYYKQKGFLPQALVNFLALMGWSYGDDQEVFSLDQMMAKFELGGLKAGGPVFDMDKLTWLNQQYIQKLSWEDFWQNFQNVDKPEDVTFEVAKDTLEQVFPLIKERLDTLQEVYTRHSYFFVDQLDLSEVQIFPKKMDADTFKQKFSGLSAELESCEWTKEGVEACFKAYKDTHELKPRDFFMPIRLMVSGRKDSPPLIPLLLSLGKDRVVERVRAAIAGIA
jgi:glutamyl-tRNA synthetase